MRISKLIELLLREINPIPRLQRCPEPTQLMDDPFQVEAFHEQGSNLLVPIYHFNALATSRLAPVGSTVVDLGSGSGQYLAYLAERRPDLRIIGLELAPTMVEVGNRFLKEKGLSCRVDLRVGDMTCFARLADPGISVISSVFSLHHLPGFGELKECLNQIREVRERTDCAIWIFDHARPRHPNTPEVFPQVFTPTAPATFNADSRNSLIAAYSFKELTAHLALAGLGSGDHWQSRWMRLYQVHRLPGPMTKGFVAPWQDAKLSASAQKNLAGLQWLFPGCSDTR